MTTTCSLALLFICYLTVIQHLPPLELVAISAYDANGHYLPVVASVHALCGEMSHSMHAGKRSTVRLARTAAYVITSADDVIMLAHAAWTSPVNGSYQSLPLQIRSKHTAHLQPLCAAVPDTADS